MKERKVTGTGKIFDFYSDIIEEKQGLPESA